MMQSWMGDGLDQLCRLLIGEVSMSGADALLGSPRALHIRFEKLGVIVGLHKEAVRGFEAILDEVGHETDIAEQPEARLFVCHDKSHGIYRVMWDRETFDAQILKIESAASGHQAPARRAAELQIALECLTGQRRGIERQWPLAAQHFQATGVILVLVGEQDAIDLIKSVTYSS